MKSKPELSVCYDRDHYPASATCSACGEEIPKDEPRITFSPKNIKWFADQFKRHLVRMHPRKLEVSLKAAV
jgi:hypothetical protein